MVSFNANSMAEASSFRQESGQDVYTDLNQLKKINVIAGKDKNAALKKMAQQFEGLFIQLMLKTMREANSVFAPEQSSEMDFHQSMFDNQLALNMAGSRGIGLADSFYQQMLIQYSDTKPAPDAQKSALVPEPALAPTPASTAPARISTVFIAEDSIPTDPSAFVEHLYPHAERVAGQLGVEPEVLIAQSALETGWGKHVIKDSRGNSSYNLFNIKADGRWPGAKVKVASVEYQDGVAYRENSSFRRYQNMTESFNDYAQFILTEPRYHDARQSNTNQDFIRALQSSGYATDPHYADKVIELLDHEVIKNYRSSKDSTRTPRG